MRVATFLILMALLWQVAEPAHTSGPQTLASYQQALELAQAKDFDRAYELVVKLVSADTLFYKANVLRIALAAILRKTGIEDPQNLMRAAKPRSPLGSDLARDVQNTIDMLRGVDAVPAKKEVEISPYIRRKLALVVGIGAFEDSRISRLRFAANDARVFAEMLERDCGFDDVKTLIDNNATTINIRNEIDNLAKKATPEDLAVVYFASHGSPKENDKAGINYVVTYNTNLDKLYATAFEMDDLLNDVKKRIPAERVVAFLDTCYSGGTFKDLPSGWISSRALIIKSSGLQMGSMEKDLRKDRSEVKIKPTAPNETRKPQGVGRVIIAASRQDEQSYEFAEDKAIQHGYFTYFLLQILRQKRAISVEDLYTQLKERVPEAVRRDTNGKEQNPTMVKSIEAPADIYLRDNQR
ncbi:MAG: caspase family protein [Blastocatellia bacterium]